jgi:hypothetical protein
LHLPAFFARARPDTPPPFEKGGRKLYRRKIITQKAPVLPFKKAKRVRFSFIPRANGSLRRYKVFESPENFFQKVFGWGLGQRPEKSRALPRAP